MGELYVPVSIESIQAEFFPDVALYIRSKVSDISLGIVRFHHERNNGNGYPQGLKGPAITRSAQVGAICDVYCTLTIDRSCRKALSSSLALQIMKQEMKGAFNDRLLDVLEGIVCTDNPGQFL